MKPKKKILINKDLSKIVFSTRKEYVDVSFKNCNFDHSTITKVVFSRCEFERCSFTEANLHLASLKECRFISCEMESVDFTRACITSCMFYDCALGKSNFAGAIGTGSSRFSMTCTSVGGIKGATVVYDTSRQCLNIVPSHLTLVKPQEHKTSTVPETKAGKNTELEDDYDDWELYNTWQETECKNAWEYAVKKSKRPLKATLDCSDMEEFRGYCHDR